MEPITMITSALAAAGTVAVEGTIQEAAKDVYVKLKNLISRRFEDRDDAKGTLALTEHEADPEIWVRPLEKSLGEADADKDQKIMETVNALIKALEDTPSGNKVLSKYNFKDCEIGATGDNMTIHGGIQVGATKKS